MLVYPPVEEQSVLITGLPRKSQPLSHYNPSLLTPSPTLSPDNHWSAFSHYRLACITLNFFLPVYFWLHCVLFVAACRLSLVVTSGAAVRRGVRASHCGGFSCCRAEALSAETSVAVACGLSHCCAHGLSCPAACGIFPDQGSNPCPLHWQVDS